MTLDEVRAQVADVAAKAKDGDDEAAHSAEDRLWEAVLRCIAADDTHDAISLCLETLKTKDIKFSRWCS